MSFHVIRTIFFPTVRFILGVNTTSNKFGLKKADSENWVTLKAEFNFHGPRPGGSWVYRPTADMVTEIGESPEQAEERRRRISSSVFNNKLNTEYKTFDELKVWFIDEELKNFIKRVTSKISLEFIGELWKVCVNTWDGLELITRRNRDDPRLYTGDIPHDYTHAREEICTVIHKLEPKLNPSCIQSRVSELLSD
ncbi:MAG: hypothetical protein JW776_12335 [Candidatus Lokiarchaeota archaeon]|nr:hypothetical protein [Candidatus Lokiarchaeota archaeon]